LDIGKRGLNLSFPEFVSLLKTISLKVQNKTINIQDLGLIDYKEAWDYQERLFSDIVAQKIENRSLEIPVKTSNHLLFVEHPHVYTLGKSGKPEHLLLSEESLKQKSAAYYKINRGGDITYHGPGQLVVYPVLDLDNFFTDIHKYMRYLEEAVIQTIAEFGISGRRVDGYTGVWLDADFSKNFGERKICAMGVKSSRWVTMHGLALNVNPDLSMFENIIACGIQDRAVSSMQKELGKPVDMEQVKQVFTEKFLTLFEAQIV
jgi:lipoyl(octanoyl) transferase